MSLTSTASDTESRRADATAVAGTCPDSLVQAVRAEVRHCRKVGKGFLLGCQFSDDVPWNARVWFG